MEEKLELTETERYFLDDDINKLKADFEEKKKVFQNPTDFLVYKYGKILNLDYITKKTNIVDLYGDTESAIIDFNANLFFKLIKEFSLGKEPEIWDDSKIFEILKIIKCNKMIKELKNIVKYLFYYSCMVIGILAIIFLLNRNDIVNFLNLKNGIVDDLFSIYLLFGLFVPISFISISVWRSLEIRNKYRFCDYYKTHRNVLEQIYGKRKKKK